MNKAPKETKERYLKTLEIFNDSSKPKNDEAIQAFCKAFANEEADNEFHKLQEEYQNE